MKPRAPSMADQRIWTVVAATVRPLAGKRPPIIGSTAASAAARPASSVPLADPPRVVIPAAPPIRRRLVSAVRSGCSDPMPPPLEARRRRKLATHRERLDRAIDLHGHDQDGARRLLTREVMRAWEDGARAVLVITGKGLGGDGVLRRRAPEWLAQPPLRSAVAGLGLAHPRHGGEGALYVALKRRPASR